MVTGGSKDTRTVVPDLEEHEIQWEARIGRHLWALVSSTQPADDTDVGHRLRLLEAFS